MPVKELIASMETGVPDNVREVASGLQYRDFITVGILAQEPVRTGQTFRQNGNRCS